MALEFLNLKYIVLSSKNDKCDYFTLNTLDLFIQNHKIEIEEDTEFAGGGVDDIDEEENQSTSDRIIYLLYKISDKVGYMSNPVFEEWKEMLESLSQEYEKNCIEI